MPKAIEKSKEVKDVMVVNGQSPVQIIMSLMDKSADMDLDRIEKFLAIQKQWEADQAKKAYHQAMSCFKAEPIEIKKDKKVNYKTDKGTTSYKHATLGNVTELINAALSKYDLSAGWELEQTTDRIKVTCRITHSMGHSESTSLSAAADTSGGKNAIQALGSTITYLERYSLLALTGIATQDQDDDGKSAEAAEEIKFISDKQKSTLFDLLDGKDVDKDKFFEYLKVPDGDHIPESKYATALAAAKAAKGSVK